MEYVIEMQDVVRNFDRKEVLKGVNLKVSPGEIFGLLGPSGAGKTTIIKILTGQLRCTKGVSMILGHWSPGAFCLPEDGNDDG